MQMEKDLKITFTDGRQEVSAHQDDAIVTFESDAENITIDCGDDVTVIPKAWDIKCPNCKVLKIKKGGFDYLNYSERRKVSSVAIPYLIKRFPVCFKVKGPVIGGEPAGQGDVKVDFWTATRIDEPARMMSCALHTPRKPQSLERVYSKYEADLAVGQQYNPTYDRFIARNFRNLMWGGLGHRDFQEALMSRISESDAVTAVWLDANCYDTALKVCDSNVEAKARVVAWGIAHYDEIQENEMKKMDADPSSWAEVLKTWFVFNGRHGACLELRKDFEGDSATVPPTVGSARIQSVNGPYSFRETGKLTRLLIPGYVYSLDLELLHHRLGITEIVLGEGADFHDVHRCPQVKVSGSERMMERFARY